MTFFDHRYFVIKLKFGALNWSELLQVTFDEQCMVPVFDLFAVSFPFLPPMLLFLKENRCIHPIKFIRYQVRELWTIKKVRFQFWVLFSAQCLFVIKNHHTVQFCFTFSDGNLENWMFFSPQGYSQSTAWDFSWAIQKQTAESHFGAYPKFLPVYHYIWTG